MNRQTVVQAHCGHLVPVPNTVPLELLDEWMVDHAAQSPFQVVVAKPGRLGMLKGTVAAAVCSDCAHRLDIEVELLASEVSSPAAEEEETQA